MPAIDKPRRAIGRHWRRRLFAGLAVVVALTGVTACGDDGSTRAADKGQGEPKRGGTLKFAVESEVANWQPIRIDGTTAGEDRGILIYDTLVLLTPTGEWRPNIALSMESADGITWRMKLRDGVKFTDGTPLDAEAVKFNVELIRDPKNASSFQSLVGHVADMKVIDPLTLDFVLKYVDGTFPNQFGRTPGMIASPTAYKADPQRFGEKPVGAGPFMVESWVRDSTLKLVRNPNYWMQGRPYLDAIEIRVMSDHVARGQALVAGDVDVVSNRAEVLRAIRGVNGLRDFSLGTNGGHALMANVSHLPGSDIRIREAIALAINPTVVNDALLLGAGFDDFACPPFTQVEPECVTGVWPRYNLARARQLVQQYVAAGNKLDTYTFLAATNAKPEAEFVQQALRDIGLQVELRLPPTPEYVTQRLSGGFDFVWAAITPKPNPGISQGIFNYAHSGQRFLQKGTPDKAFDAAMEKSIYALDPKVRLEAAREVQRINAKDFIMIWFAPYIRGLAGKSDVVLGDRYTGSSVLVGQDAWIDR